MDTIRKYISIVFLLCKVLFGNGKFNRYDSFVAKEFYHVPGMDFIAGLTEYGLTLTHSEPRIDLISYLKGE